MKKRNKEVIITFLFMIIVIIINLIAYNYLPEYVETQFGDKNLMRKELFLIAVPVCMSIVNIRFIEKDDNLKYSHISNNLRLTFKIIINLIFLAINILILMQNL